MSKYKINPTLLNNFLFTESRCNSLHSKLNTQTFALHSFFLDCYKRRHISNELHDILVEYDTNQLVNLVNHATLQGLASEIIQSNIDLIKNLQSLESELKLVKQTFYEQLNKTFYLDSLAAAKGNEFEALIEARTQNKDWNSLSIKCFTEPAYNLDKFKQVVDSLASIVRGGKWQVKVEGLLTCPETTNTYLLNGKLDILMPTQDDVIYDIKYTGKKTAAKFEFSTQHRLYMLCVGAQKFSYLISDGSDWWREDYRRHPEYDKKFLLNSINRMFAFIYESPEMIQALEKHWLLNN